ncbi:MAG: DUF790 family protein [Armatimonadota bacterium]
MLTLDLLRYRVNGDAVAPTFLSVTGGRKYRDLAARVIDAFAAGVGKTRGEFDSALAEMTVKAEEFKVFRGLCKLMADYLVIAPPAEGDAEDLRRQVFTLAAQAGPLVRHADLLFPKAAAETLAEIADQLGMAPEEVSASLYADLKESQFICAIDTTLTPEDLLERYNTALAQAMLYRATRMVVEIRDNFRQVVKHVKLARLMHTITPLETGYRLVIDGPYSLLANIERYGIAMAHVLPALLKCREWRLAARVRVGNEEKTFRLGPSAGLKSHYRDEPQFDSAAEEAFFHRFSRNSKSKWAIAREGAVLQCKDLVMIPDFTFTHRDGRIVHLEIVGFWTPQYLARKLQKLNNLTDATVVIAVPDALNCARELFSGQVIHFKQRLLIKDVLPALEAAAQRRMPV